MMPRSPSKPDGSAGGRPDGERRFAEQAGRRGEALAALFLKMKGYRIVGRRVKTPVGEIDLVVRRGGTIVFVEVKARAFSSGEAGALGAVNRQRIVRAAQYWLARHSAEAGQDLRFDVIFLAPFAWPRHLSNAFDATGLGT